MEEKKKIKVLIAYGTGNQEYVDFLNKRFEVELVKYDHTSKQYIVPDLILFTGGDDINPNLYMEKIGSNTYCDSKRDAVEVDIFKKFKGRKMLGICRGAQFLTVMAKGKLIQDVTGHQREHVICTSNGGEVNMTSSHHQMMYPFNINKNNYELIAYSKYFQSESYLNGDNKETELKDEFLEPEIISYPQINALCIQGHPEWASADEVCKIYCLDLIEKHINKPNYGKTVVWEPIKEYRYKKHPPKLYEENGDGEDEDYFEDQYEGYYEDDEDPFEFTPVKEEDTKETIESPDVKGSGLSSTLDDTVESKFWSQYIVSSETIKEATEKMLEGK